MIPTVSLEEKILKRLHELFPDPVMPLCVGSAKDWDQLDAQVTAHIAEINRRMDAIVDVLLELAEERLKRPAAPVDPKPAQQSDGGAARDQV